MLRNTFLTKHFKKNAFFLASCLIASTFVMNVQSVTGVAFANTVDTELPEVIVTGAAEPSSVRSIPATVQVITRKDIDRTGTTTLVDVLDRVLPGSFQPQQGGLISVGMRGFRNGSSQGNTWGDGILTLIDGNRTNIGSISLFPLGNVERIEIVRGPSSVIYGASALGGVINIITKRGKGKASGKIGAEYGSFGSWKGTASISGGVGENDKLGYALALQRSHTGDYQDGDDNTRINSQTNNGTVSATATIRPDDKTNLSLTFNHASLFGMGSPGDANWPITPNDSVNSLATYGALDFSRTLDNDVYINTSAYMTKTNYSFSAPPNWSSEIESSQVGFRALTGIPIMTFGRLALGGEYSHTSQSNNDVFAGVPSNSQPDGEYDIFGFFAEYKTDIGPVALQMGLRYDNFDAQTSSNGMAGFQAGSQSFDQLSWQAGATYWMLDWLGVRASTGTSFTPPTPHQLNGNFPGFFGAPYQGNPDLDPENAWSTEVGFEIDYTPFSASIAYFSTELKDAIEEDTNSIPGVTTFRNAGKQRIAGFEALLKLDHTVAVTDKLNMQFAPYLNAEYFTKREDRANNNDLVFRLPKYNITYGLGLGFDYPVPIWFDINARTTGSQENSAPVNTEMDSFTVINLGLKVDPIKDLSIYFNVTNLTDREYSYIAGYPMPGRGMTMGMEYRF